jgi:hypothetical protein
VLEDRRARRNLPEPTAHGDVLVAVAPWVRETRPILDAVRALDPRPRSVTLATVLDAEDARTQAGSETAREGEAFLRRCCSELEASGLVGGPVECTVRYGFAADELAKLANSGGYERIVLGPSASATHHLVHGRTRARLERQTSSPILRPGVRREVVA